MDRTDEDWLKLALFFLFLLAIAGILAKVFAKKDENDHISF